jgi:hypothetical protein
MKIAKVYDPKTNQVTAWSQVFHVSWWCEWISIDADGEIVFWEDKPIARADSWVGYGDIIYKTKHYGKAEDFGDWRKCLVRIGDKEF